MAEIITVFTETSHGDKPRPLFASNAPAVFTSANTIAIVYNTCLPQAKYKQAREERKILLTPAHKYMFELLAHRLYLEPTAVEEFILDSSSLSPFDNFFSEGGNATISFVYQEAAIPGIECGRLYPRTTTGENILRLFLANMSQTCLKGICCFFTRNRVDIAVNLENIHEVRQSRMSNFTLICLDALDGLVKGTRNVFNFVLPALEAENWGVLDKSRHGQQLIQNFKDTIKHCLCSLDDIQMRNESIVHLNTVTDIDFSTLASLDDMKVAAADCDMVHRLEEILMQWYKQIEEVLKENDSIRKEVDSAGLLSELEHWEKMSLQFNSIINHIKGPECKAVVMVLHIRRSKMITKWRELDARLTDLTNEAKDNVKYLDILEKVFCYILFIRTLIINMNNVIDAIQMIYSVSQYYNTSKSITVLFLKVTNQMVTACRSYITNNGTCLIWEQDAKEIIKKFQVMMILIKTHIAISISTKRPCQLTLFCIYCRSHK
uniref:Dynein heavy chain tail domain-containing protein n=1 Tax=Cyclopterus lumpus TaxID=8103 RepID=A0A8C3AGP9_CYCLU